MRVLNIIFIEQLFRIEGSGNLPDCWGVVQKIYLYYNNKGNKSR